MALTPFTGPTPQRNDRATFSDRVDAFITWFLDTFMTEIDAVVDALNLNDVTDTSTSSVLIGDTGTKTFTVTAGKGFLPGQYLTTADTAAPSTNLMVVIVFSYSGTTLTTTAVYAKGSGTKASWQISFSAPFDEAADPTGMVLLSTVTAASDATVDIETTFDSTYDAYELVVSNLKVADAAVNLFCRLKISGTYQTTNYNYHMSRPISSASTYDGSSQVSSTSIILGLNLTNAAPDTVSFRMHLNNPTGTTEYNTVSWNGSVTAGSTVQNVSGAGMQTTLAALTGVRIYASAGNIASGEFRLYGIRNI